MESSTKVPAGTASNGASSNGAGQSFDVHNPATGEVIRSVPIGSAAQVTETVARVRANQADWEALGNKGRAQWLAKLRDWLLDNYDAVSDTMQQETGKVRADTGGEVVYLADTINFYGKMAPKFIGDDKVRAHNPLMRSKKL